MQRDSEKPSVAALKAASVAAWLRRVLASPAMWQPQEDDPELDEGGPLVVGLLASMTVLLLGAIILRG